MDIFRKRLRYTALLLLLLRINLPKALPVYIQPIVFKGIFMLDPRPGAHVLC